MDKGAHFHRCDFQVHTPRDLNWHVHKAHSEEERRNYSTNFIKACREKGLNAVAITDHHDLGFFPFIQAASRNEVDQNGHIVDENARIKVFPGMELTLAVPCQALLIFDENLPLDCLSTIPVALGISTNGSHEPKHLPTTRLDRFKELQHICAVLDAQEKLRGRYILLPNVNDGGQFSIMRTGFVGEYRTMPCVGGYLDHGVESIGHGTRKILDGKVDAYDFKGLGLFPTSDNRHDNFSLLGRNTAWVKWSEPTAEALRQACLARRTRILHEAPRTPNVFIGRIQISNCKFLGPLDLWFNSQFSCLIGGRGTGKSTVLEYVRWALCDQTASSIDESDDGTQISSKRRKLIENTLQCYVDASVTVEVFKNGVKHVVRRKANPHELLLKVGDDEMKVTTPDEITDLLPIQGYSQKQLSGVGVRKSELMRFVESAGTREALVEFESQSKELANAVRRAFHELEEKRSSVKSGTHLKLQLSSLQQQLSTLKNNLLGISDADRTTISEHEEVLAGQAAFRQFDSDQQQALSAIQRAQREISTLPSRLPSSIALKDESEVLKAQQEATSAFEKVKETLEAAARSLSPSSADWAEYRNISTQWQARCKEHEIKYHEVQSRLSEQQQTLTEIASLEERISALKTQINEIEASANGLENTEQEYNQLRTDWRNQFAVRGDLLERRCAQLTIRSDGWIRARLKRGVMGARLEEQITRLLQGTGRRNLSDKLTNLTAAITNHTNPMEYWEEVLHELDCLTRNSRDEDVSSEFELLKNVGFNEGDLEKISERMTRAAWLDLSLIELEDHPVFDYRQREAEYIGFSEASAGQQATALLRVLLNQDGPPLLIDQPEDDLDNEVIHEIAELIGSAKQRRQLIFTSHNANLVVNGDSDLVVSFGYRVAGEQSLGEIQAEGAIDQKSIRDRITAVMEGGEKAFYLRKEKYGF